MKQPITISEEQWEQIIQEHPELEKKKSPKMNSMIGGKSGETKVRYGEGYTSLAGNNWKKLLAFGALEGLLAILTVVFLALGLGLCLIGTISLKGWTVFGGFILTCLGIISGIVCWQLHDRI